MSRSTYAPKQTYVGNGTLSAYTFNFKVEADTQLEIVEMDNLGVETQRVRGDDTVYLTSVAFNPITGGGTVNLTANLATGYSLIILLANDAPTQLTEFSNKLSFNLKTIERALDFILGPIQRLTYKSKQALRIHDSEDEETFNAQLPPDILGNAGNVLKVNDLGDGFEFGEANAPVTTTAFTVTIPGPQGRFNNGDIIPVGTLLEQIQIDMLQVDTPPIFSLAGNAPLLVESGTLITPTLTPTFTANDAGPSNAYSLFKDAVPIFGPVLTPVAHGDTPFNIVDVSVVYHATVSHDANILPAGNLISGNVTYRGARAAFSDLVGDLITIRNNNLSNIGVSGGSSIAVTGDAVPGKKMMMWAYPASLGAPTALNYFNGLTNFPVIGDIVRETDQMVDDANASNPILYRVYSYTQLIDFTAVDVLTLTI